MVKFEEPKLERSSFNVLGLGRKLVCLAKTAETKSKRPPSGAFSVKPCHLLCKLFGAFVIHFIVHILDLR